MKAAKFDYLQPRALDEALRALQPSAAATGIKAMGGSQSFGPMLNLRLTRPRQVVDISRLAPLRELRVDGQTLRIGAAVTHAEIEDGVHEVLRGSMLQYVAGGIAYRAVRNRGTMGGSLVHADPAADWPSTMLLVGATMLVAGPAGRREIPVESFFTSIFETSMKQGEILVGIRVPKRGPKTRRAYWKFCRKTGEFPQAIGAALLDPDKGESRAVIGATLSTPILLSNAKALLAKPTEDALNAAADEAGFADDPYNRRLHAVALRRAIERLSA